MTGDPKESPEQPTAENLLGGRKTMRGITKSESTTPSHVKTRRATLTDRLNLGTNATYGDKDRTAKPQDQAGSKGHRLTCRARDKVRETTVPVLMTLRGVRLVERAGKEWVRGVTGPRM